MKTKWVAEIGSNHNGSLLRAVRLIDAAAKAGFASVKTQHFRVKELFEGEALKRNPKLRERERYEIPNDWHETLRDRAHEHGMAYGITPLYFDALSDVGAFTDWWKVSSYQLTCLPLLRRVAASGKPIVVSTGMATMEECLAARSALMGTGKMVDLTFLHCVSRYPALPSTCNLKAIDSMQKQICWPIGWSDHTVEPEVVKRAIWRWRARMVEMHFDLEDGRGAETEHSWLPQQAADVIEEASEEIPQDLDWRCPELDGDGTKQPTAEEAHERLWRSDSLDGLRPTKEMQEIWRQATTSSSTSQVSWGGQWDLGSSQDQTSKP